MLCLSNFVLIMTEKNDLKCCLYSMCRERFFQERRCSVEKY